MLLMVKTCVRDDARHESNHRPLLRRQLLRWSLKSKRDQIPFETGQIGYRVANGNETGQE